MCDLYEAASINELTNFYPLSLHIFSIDFTIQKMVPVLLSTLSLLSLLQSIIGRCLPGQTGTRLVTFDNVLKSATWSLPEKGEVECVYR